MTERDAGKQNWEGGSIPRHTQLSTRLQGRELQGPETQVPPAEAVLMSPELLGTRLPWLPTTPAAHRGCML